MYLEALSNSLFKSRFLPSPFNISHTCVYRMKFQIPGVKNIVTVEQNHISQEKESTSPEVSERHSSQTEMSDDTTPAGVKRIEATTQVWAHKALIITYLSIFIIYFVNSFQQQVSGNLLAYVTSDFGQHALLSTTGVVSSVVGGVLKLPLARFLDVVGRPQGFALMVFVTTMGKSTKASGMYRPLMNPQASL